MKIEQRKWTQSEGWSRPVDREFAAKAQLVFVFGAKSRMREGVSLEQIVRDYPSACFLGCSTAGEICDTQVSDETLVVNAVLFSDTRICMTQVTLDTALDSQKAGNQLCDALLHQYDQEAEWPLVHIFLLSDGLRVNGSALVKGLIESLPPGILVTGGLAADGSDFGETLVWTGGKPQSGLIAAVGFYGKRLRIGCGSQGGWDPFGPERLITRSDGNVLYEVDGQSILSVYKRYLGEHASGLPATGLLFPLSLRTGNENTPVVRTILSVDEKAQSLTFAGDVPEGAYCRLMKANYDRLIDGAISAARTGEESIDGLSADLALLISCVGRKLVLKQRVEEELEGVREILGPSAVMTGFYSYGEISPFTPGAKCELHNQTMTITTLLEL